MQSDCCVRRSVLRTIRALSPGISAERSMCLAPIEGEEVLLSNSCSWECQPHPFSSYLTLLGRNAGLTATQCGTHGEGVRTTARWQNRLIPCHFHRAGQGS
jgi:hypothetical protein